MDKIVGIDLGTTHSAIATVRRRLIVENYQPLPTVAELSTIPRASLEVFVFR